MLNSQILDTTIRDGSYAVDFKFTRNDVANIVSRLVRLGIQYIEIGHGMGLNASSPERGVALYSDEEYIDAARKVSGDSKIGMFCIPGIARLEDLDKASAHGIDFVRIGVTVENIFAALPYIEHSLRVGLIPMINFMKSYASSPAAFSKSAEIAMENGGEYIYLVDSAGCMLPEEIEAFYDACMEKCPGIKLGFHEHNNLGLSVSNSLKCVDLGFSLIDTSFQGLGRSIGNTPTEMFVMALKRKYGEDAVAMDVPRLLEYGYVALKEIGGWNLNNPLELICGYTGFHSSFIKDIYKCCSDVGVDPLRLIMAYSAFNKVNMDHNKLYELAQSLPKDEVVDEHPYNFRMFFDSKN